MGFWTWIVFNLWAFIKTLRVLKVPIFLPTFKGWPSESLRGKQLSKWLDSAVEVSKQCPLRLIEGMGTTYWEWPWRTWRSWREEVMEAGIFRREWESCWPSMNKVRWGFFSPVVLQGLELEDEKRNLACTDRGSIGMEGGGLWFWHA